MWDLQACTVCFSIDVKLYKIHSGRLRREFFLVSGLKADDTDGMPQYLCMQCCAYVKKYIKFRDKCKRAHFTLKEILRRNKEIKLSNLECLDRVAIGTMPALSLLDLDKMHYDTAKFQWVKHNRLSISNQTSIPTFHYTTIALEDEFEMCKKKDKVTDSVNTVNKAIVKVEADSIQSYLDIDFSMGNKGESFLKQSTTTANNDDLMDNYFDNDIDVGSDAEGLLMCKQETKDDPADGAENDEEYATAIAISEKEAKAAVEVYKMFSQGKYSCAECKKTFHNENRYQAHLRMHDQHSGSYYCALCQYYYKSEFLLKSHLTEKHLFKYLCRKCPEVNFDRMSAKQHFVWKHLQKGSKKNANWYDMRPKWLQNRGGRRIKGVVTLRPVRKIKKLPNDFPIYTPVTHEEQYQMVVDRKKTRNYLEAQFKCELCYRGFREMETYANHMKKHDPAISGNLQCDMCKLYFLSARKMYKHMNITHLFKYSCQTCSYVCYNRSQAQSHYRWHKNVTYDCPHCNKEFKKASTRLTHIRIKHPSMFICNLCGHSYVSENGLYCHKKLSHSAQEIEQSESTPLDTDDVQYCADCNVQFMSDAAYKVHLGSSFKHATTNVSVKPLRRARAGPRRTRGRPKTGTSDIVNNGVPTATHCEVCDKFLSNDVQARKHYEAEHPGADYLKRYMCDVCGHTTRQYANLMVHMRTHTREKPYDCPHCDRRFSMPSNRDRHLVVHTGEKRYQCQHCNRRFTQSSAVKLHIQTVHLKIPYAPWDKKNRKRRKELEGAGAPASGVVPVALLQTKLVLETNADYLNAYITYNE